MELLNFLHCHWLSAFFLPHDQGRSEEGLALCHFSGWACFMDMCLGASFVYLSCVGCSSSFLHHCFNHFLISAKFFVIAVSGWFEQYGCKCVLGKCCWAVAFRKWHK